MSFYFLKESIRQEQSSKKSLREQFLSYEEEQKSTVPTSDFPVKIKKEIDAWQHLENPPRISKIFYFDDAGQQRFFVSQLMKSLDIQNHNIWIEINQKTVKLETGTIIYDQITEIDLEIARLADDLYQDALYIVVTDEFAI